MAVQFHVVYDNDRWSTPIMNWLGNQNGRQPWTRGRIQKALEQEYKLKVVPVPHYRFAVMTENEEDEMNWSCFLVEHG